ncbi:hypothetical protein, partial [Variovorax boronicumulans]|uniref:hypothetical protein n=1 Tax=Variovorax boronicumulans TaxID=436515 RepID=UPI001C5987A7
RSEIDASPEAWPRSGARKLSTKAQARFQQGLKSMPRQRHGREAARASFRQKRKPDFSKV